MSNIKKLMLLSLSCFFVAPLYAQFPQQPVFAEADAPVASARPENFPRKDSAEAAILRGESVYKRYCVLCHGAEADGTGRAAKRYDPRPANLRKSDKNSLYKVMIITKGGGAVGRSPFMPPWGEELTTEQITDVVSYLNKIAENPPKD